MTAWGGNDREGTNSVTAQFRNKPKAMVQTAKAVGVSRDSPLTFEGSSQPCDFVFYHCN